MDGRSGFQIEVPAGVVCPHCSVILQFHEGTFGDYFGGVESACPACDQTFDWWDAVLRHITEDFGFSMALAPVGARLTLAKVTLRPGSFAELNLAEHGVPSDAKVLNIVYTPGLGGLAPVEFYGNVPPRHIIRHLIMLYPVPLGMGQHSDTVVNVFVSWVPHTPNDYAWQNLVDAFEAFSVGRYSAMVIPANVAVESTLGHLLAASLRKVASREHVESFLQNGATYSHQLNVVLPSLLIHVDAPRLPPHIRGALNRLRDLRNQMAHQGALDRPFERNEAAVCLCAALFGFHYLNMARSFVLRQ